MSNFGKEDIIKGRRFIYWIDPCGWQQGEGHRVSLVVENESGHFPTGGFGHGDPYPWYWGDPIDCEKSLREAKKTAREANQKIGITEEAALEILSSSIRLSMAH